MKGKRFWIDTLEIGHIYINDNDKHLSWMEVVDLLNNQQERIQDLEKKLKHTTTLNDECQESFAPLVVENKELKHLCPFCQFVQRFVDKLQRHRA